MPVGGGGGGASQPSASVTLTSAQLLDIKNTPVVVVAAPGAGKYVVPTRVFYTYRAGTTPYTVTNPSLLFMHQGGSAHLFVIFLDLLSESTDQANFENEGQGAYFPLASALNKALTVSVVVDPPTGGNGTLELVIEYAGITP